jgi:transcriptional regulator with XRE-family HTH domain
MKNPEQILIEIEQAYGRGKRIGQLIAEFRESLNLSRSEFAFSLEVSPATLSRWENNKVTTRKVSLRRLRRLISGVTKSPDAQTPDETLGEIITEPFGRQLSRFYRILLKQDTALARRELDEAVTLVEFHLQQLKSLRKTI